MTPAFALHWRGQDVRLPRQIREGPNDAPLTSAADAMVTILYIALGGAIGTIARYALNLAITTRTGELFPWGTLTINVVGSFAIGLFAALTGPGGRVAASTDARLFVLVGLCGGFTTFSSFSLQTLALFEAGEPLRAGANVVASVTLCLFAVWLGSIAPNLMRN